MLERRRRYLIIRVDRADLSKNVLRGFTAFDTFLTQHPEFREQVTFIAHLQPSRQDVPEYAEYRERIEALVAVVNHRHGTTDWMPIDLRIYENFADAVARYKHYDLLMVNAIFDGMNLVAKEAPAVNTRDGVLMLSENTGSHQELEDWVISVNPFDIQEQSDSIYRALTMDAEKKSELAQGLREIIFSPQPRRLGRRPDRRHRKSPRRADFLLVPGGEIRSAAPLAGGGGRADQMARGRRGWRRSLSWDWSRCGWSRPCCAHPSHRRWAGTSACRRRSRRPSCRSRSSTRGHRSLPADRFPTRPPRPRRSGPGPGTIAPPVPLAVAARRVRDPRGPPPNRPHPRPANPRLRSPRNPLPNRSRRHLQNLLRRPDPCPATGARSSRRTNTAIVRRRLWPHPVNTSWS